jgi:hypothetical protein
LTVGRAGNELEQGTRPRWKREGVTGGSFMGFLRAGGGLPPEDQLKRRLHTERQMKERVGATVGDGQGPVLADIGHGAKNDTAESDRWKIRKRWHSDGSVHGATEEKKLFQETVN